MLKLYVHGMLLVRCVWRVCYWFGGFNALLYARVCASVLPTLRFSRESSRSRIGPRIGPEFVHFNRQGPNPLLIESEVGPTDSSDGCTRIFYYILYASYNFFFRVSVYSIFSSYRTTWKTNQQWLALCSTHWTNLNFTNTRSRLSFAGHLRCFKSQGVVSTGFLSRLPVTRLLWEPFSPSAVLLHSVKRSSRKAISYLFLLLGQERFSHSEYMHAHRHIYVAERNNAFLASQNNVIKVSWTHPILSFQMHNKNSLFNVVSRCSSSSDPILQCSLLGTWTIGTEKLTTFL